MWRKMRFGRIVAAALVLTAGSCGEPKQQKTTSQPVAEIKESMPAVDAAVQADRSAPFQPPQLLTREEIDSGWISLFDGHSLFGWRPNSDANWDVRDGTLLAEGGNSGLLLTRVPFGNYELRFDIRLEQGGNSGVFLRTTFDPTDPSRDCFEFNICDSHPDFPTGSVVGRQRVQQQVAGEGDWKSFRVLLEGSTLVATCEGEPVISFSDQSDGPIESGLIGLQFRSGRVEFRNVFLKPLGMSPLFNGNDLTGWRVVPGSKGAFEVVEGGIHVHGGGGFLETDSVWDNFVLQAEAKTNVKETNGGIFFRAMRGTEAAPSNGYELQIHNGFEGNDRSLPNDYGTGFGTGAIFRRLKARRIVADDLEWCTLTLVAHGPEFASWVNGYQVTAWTDERESHENPRRGRRIEAGHLSLQGHDASTDLTFRDVQISEIPERVPLSEN